MFQQNNHNIILPKYFESVKRKGSSLALPANGLGGSRATSLSVAHFALQNTKFGSKKGKVQKPARIPPQTPPAGGKKAEAGQFHSPRKIVCPADLSAVALAEAESKLVFRIFVKKSSNINQKTPPIKKSLFLGIFLLVVEFEREGVGKRKFPVEESNENLGLS